LSSGQLAQHTVLSAFRTHSVQKAPNFTWHISKSWLACVALHRGSEEVNQRYPIKKNATLLVVTGRGLLGLPRFMKVGD